MMMYTEYLDTPIGILEIAATHRGLTKVLFVDKHSPSNGGSPKSAPDSLSGRQANDKTMQCRAQLSEYFAGRRQTFELTLDVNGTDFQQSVWHSLMTVNYGESASYSDIALMIDNPRAVRAVGAANGRNPISIIVPCHRVIGRNGTLTGYAGGMERKAWLLAHEAKHRGA